MSSRQERPGRGERRSVATLARELAALDGMSAGELAEKYLEVFGEPRHTRNKEYLRKHIAWRMQERAEGGLSARAIDRIDQIAPEAPARWRQPIESPRRRPAAQVVQKEHDPRLPPIGHVLTRVHGGIEHQVTIRASGFEYQGRCHRSLSAIARLITGSSWNGYVFFLGRKDHSAGRAR